MIDIIYDISDNFEICEEEASTINTNPDYSQMEKYKYQKNLTSKGNLNYNIHYFKHDKSLN